MPGLELQSKTIVLPPLSVQTVSEQQLEAHYPSDATPLVEALVTLTRAVSRRNFRVASGGWLSANQYPTLEKELKLFGRELPALLVLEIAERADIVVQQSGILRPGPLAEALLKTPLPELMGQLLHAFVHSPAWQDDAPGKDGAELWEAHRSPYLAYSMPVDRSDVVPARFLVLTSLKRVSGNGWISLDALVSEVLLQRPELFLPQSYPGAKRSLSEGQMSSHRVFQRAFVLAFLTRSCTILGLVDLATLRSKEPSGTPRTLPHFATPGLRERSWMSYEARPAGHRAQPDQNSDSDASLEHSGLAIRLSALGRAILLGEQVVAPVSHRPVLTIGTDFEVLALREGLSAELKLRLQSIAAPLPGHPLDPMLRFRLERERLIQTLKTGIKLEELLQMLETGAQKAIPVNIVRTLQDWSRSYGALKLYVGQDLLEFPTPKAQAAMKPKILAVERIGDRFALAQSIPWSVPILDYNAQPLPCLRWPSADTVELETATSDLIIEGMLSQFTELGPKPGQYRLTRESVKGSAQDAASIGTLLRQRTRGPLPARMILSLRGWRGELPPVAVQAVTLLQVSDAPVMELLKQVPELAALVQGQLSPELLLVTSDKVAELHSLLESLGVETSRALETGALRHD